MLRVDAVKGKLSLSLKPSAVDGDSGGASPGAERSGGAGSEGEEEDLDEEMAARLEALERHSDDEVWFRRLHACFEASATIDAGVRLEIDASALRFAC